MSEQVSNIEATRRAADEKQTAASSLVKSKVGEDSAASPLSEAKPTATRVLHQAPPADAPARVVSNLFRGFSNPLAATTRPVAPAGNPILWSLLAFTRREFDTASKSPPATEIPVSVQAADQSLVAEERTLVLTAFPAEADAILARTTLDPNPSVVVDGRHYYLGTLGGKKVIVAMTGIGMENATQTTEQHSTTSRPNPASRSMQWSSRALPVAPDAPKSAVWPYPPDGPPTTAQPGMRSMPACSPQPTQSPSTC